MFRPFCSARVAIVCGLFVLTGSAQDKTPKSPKSPAGGQLEKVAPLPTQEGPRERMQRLLTGDFDGDEWVELLQIPDLGERENYYEALLQRARVDPQARAFLEKLSRDPKLTEVAWTARMALRELGRPNFPLHNLFRFDNGAPSEFDAIFDQLQEQGMLTPFGLAHPLQGQDGEGQGNTSLRVEVSQSPEGARIVVVEQREGEEEERIYEGESIDDILAKHPELKKQIGVGLQSFGGQGNIRFQLTPPGSPRSGLVDPLESFGGLRTLDELFRGRRPGLSTPGETAPVRTDKLGVKVAPLSREDAERLGIEPGVGLYVLSTAPGTFAYHFGVRRGHVLLQLNDRKLRVKGDIGAVLQNRDPLSSIELIWMDELGQKQARRWTPVGRKK